MKTALITGSTKGIGLQIGLDLLKQDYFVYFNGRHPVSIPNEYNYRLISADVSKIGCIEFIRSYFEYNGDFLDVLVLNAGMTDRTPFGTIDYNKWLEVFSMNLTVPFFLVQALADIIKPGGKIIFISSISGCTTDSLSVSYGVSKGAIHVLVPYLAKEFASKNITVNAICPAYIKTDWHDSKAPEQIKRIEQKHLVNRLGTVQEVSKAVMAVIDNDFINAQVLRVDGGFLV